MNVNFNSYGKLNERYVTRIRETIMKSIQEHPRTLLLRVDLRLPDLEALSFTPDSSIITRFIASLKSQITADIKQKQKVGKRTHDCSVRHIWVREFNEDRKQHYHIVLMFNKDTYAYPGTYKPGLMSDEASVFFAGRAKNNLGFLNQLWDGSPFDVERRNGGSFSVEGRFSMLLMIQPDLFMQYFKRHGKIASGSGFYLGF